jgi:DNA-binding response OmpR family regulator
MNRKLILVIDNDESILEIISIVLQDTGFNVVSSQAPNFSLLSTNIPDLIILDISPDNKQHRLFYDHIKVNGATAKIPVMLTSTCNGLDKVASNWNAECYLAKPFDIYGLATLVDTHLNTALPILTS